jgi:hypothetical protein
VSGLHARVEEYGFRIRGGPVVTGFIRLTRTGVVSKVSSSFIVSRVWYSYVTSQNDREISVQPGCRGGSKEVNYIGGAAGDPERTELGSTGVSLSSCIYGECVVIADVRIPGKA